jgi:hypothetical protein
MPPPRVRGRRHRASQNGSRDRARRAAAILRDRCWGKSRAMHNGVDDFALVHAIDGVQKLAASGDVLFLGDHRHQEGRSDAIEPVGIGLDVYRICPIFLFTAPAPFYNLVHSIEAFPGRRPLPVFFCLIVRKPAGAPGM